MHCYQHYQTLLFKNALDLSLEKKDRKKVTERNTEKSEIFLSKYNYQSREVFKMLEAIISMISPATGDYTLTVSEVNCFGEILDKMYEDPPEKELEGMIAAIEKLLKLKIRIWKRLDRRS